VGLESQTPLSTLVASFTSTLDAELARTLLGSHDIPARLEGDVLVGAALPLQTAFGGVRVLVTAEDAVRARDLIDQHEKELAADRRRSDTADHRVARAYRLSLIGLMLLPLVAHVISLINIVRVPWSALSPKGRRHYLIGIAFDLVVIGAALYWLIDSTWDHPPDVTNTIGNPGW
jgi:hypothetical protein